MLLTFVTQINKKPNYKLLQCLIKHISPNHNAKILKLRRQPITTNTATCTNTKQMSSTIFTHYNFQVGQNKISKHNLK